LRIIIGMTTTSESTQPPPPPARRRLERSRNDRYVGGVCGGLGRYFDVDPVIFRVVIACMAIFGAGLILYAVGWAFIPEEGEALSVAQATGRGDTRARELLVIAFVVLAGLAAINGVFGPHHFGDGGWLVPVFVIGGAFWWLREHGHGTGERALLAPPPAPPAWPLPPAAPPAGPPGPSAFWAATATAPPAMASPPAAVSAPPTGAWAYEPPAKAERERSRLGALTISALLLAVGIAALLDAAGAISLSAQAVLATALLVVGGGLVVGARYGRSRGLIALGLLLTLAVSAVAVVDVPLRGGTGDVTWQPLTRDELARGYHLRAGSAVLDLNALVFLRAFNSTDVNRPDADTVEVTVGFGNLTILVPDEVTTRVQGHLGAGTVTVFDHQQDGVDVDIDSGDSGKPHIVINAKVGLGDLEVRHQTS
jgi:phage shock protein PspC (stress-responsive transcriptional regulator)